MLTGTSSSRQDPMQRQSKSLKFGFDGVAIIQSGGFLYIVIIPWSLLLYASNHNGSNIVQDSHQKKIHLPSSCLAETLMGMGSTEWPVRALVGPEWAFDFIGARHLW